MRLGTDLVDLFPAAHQGTVTISIGEPVISNSMLAVNSPMVNQIQQWLKEYTQTSGLFMLVPALLVAQCR